MVVSLPDATSEICISSKRGVVLHGYLLTADSSELLIFYHGNWGNIDYRLQELVNLRGLGVNVLGISYRGFGRSNGIPSERGIYQDGIQALKYAENSLGFSRENITLLGRSLGSTVAVEVAAKYSVRRLILVTPLSSGRLQLKAVGKTFVSFFVGDVFNNLRKISGVPCPILFIHGTSDKVTPLEMSYSLCKLTHGRGSLAIIHGSDHNNISTIYAAEYERAIKTFLAHK